MKKAVANWSGKCVHSLIVIYFIFGWTFHLLPYFCNNYLHYLIPPIMIRLYNFKYIREWVLSFNKLVKRIATHYCSSLLLIVFLLGFPWYPFFLTSFRFNLFPSPYSYISFLGHPIELCSPVSSPSLNHTIEISQNDNIQSTHLCLSENVCQKASI